MIKKPGGVGGLLVREQSRMLPYHAIRAPSSNKMVAADKTVSSTGGVQLRKREGGERHNPTLRRCFSKLLLWLSLSES